MEIFMRINKQSKRVTHNWSPHRCKEAGKIWNQPNYPYENTEMVKANDSSLILEQ